MLHVQLPHRFTESASLAASARICSASAQILLSDAKGSHLAKQRAAQCSIVCDRQLAKARFDFALHANQAQLGDVKDPSRAMQSVGFSAHTLEFSRI